MNKTRRKKINDVIVLLTKIKDYVDDILDEEQDYYDNIPENLQGSEKAEASEDAIDVLNETYGLLEEAIDYLGGLI